MTAIRALVFDLYGTLLHVEDPAFEKGMARLVGAPRRDWAVFLRDVVLARAFATPAALVEAVLKRFPAEDPERARREGVALLERELASVRPEASLASILGFFSRRGFRIGVLTNSASPFREPFERFGIAEKSGAAVFSCDLGVRKPALEAYREILARLEAPPDESLMIGDSLPNDVVGAEAAGMRALGIGNWGKRECLGSFSELAWLTGFEDGAPSLLVHEGAPFDFRGRAGRLAQIDLLPDPLQGRYNLVARVDVEWSAGARETMYLKRFRHPDAIQVEEFVHRLLAEVGISTCDVAILPGTEPLLLSSTAAGEKLGAPVPDPPLAREIGRHGASAYLFANADLRPRNSFLIRRDGEPHLTMVDYEYSLFDRAIDLGDVAGRLDPRALDGLGAEELIRRSPRRVVTRGAIQRTRRAFFDAKSVDAATIQAFRDGWLEVHRRARAAAPRLEALLRERLERRPYLIVGTEAYRRAFLPIDVEDLLARVATDPDEACGFCF